jgi:1-acyl-sn-glycerol-3-phosphate acyltransferase
MVLTAVFAVIALLSCLFLPFTRRRRVLRSASYAVLYLTMDLAVILACFGLWLRSPLPTRDQDRWERNHSALLRWAVTRVISGAQRCLGFRMELEEPPDAAKLCGQGPLLVLSRHAGPGDSFAIPYLLITRYHRQPRIVLKDVLQLDPAIDVLLNRLSCCFLSSRTGTGDDLAESVARIAGNLEESEALLIFPEGGNWTPGRRRRAISSLRRRARHRPATVAEELTHVLPPRPAGALAALAARPDAAVVVVAHTGLDSITSTAAAWRALPVSDRPMRLRWWWQPVDTLPSDAGARQRWLEWQWVLVDEWIDARTSQAEQLSAGGVGN